MLVCAQLQELLEEADFQAARVARAQAALAPELTEPEVATALAECHAEIAHQTAKEQQKCGAGLREGSLHMDPFRSLPELTQVSANPFGMWLSVSQCSAR